ncbi:hypothetical protein ACFL6G_01775, partial [candidate division KSB1 bacterium]
LAGETGAGTVISGSYFRQGDMLRFRAKITNSNSEEVIFDLKPAITSGEEWMTSLEDMRQRILGGTAFILSDPIYMHYIDNTNTPPRYDALQELIAGMRFFSPNPPKAIEHFTRGYKIDTTFNYLLLNTTVVYSNSGDISKVDSLIQKLYGKYETLSPFNRAFADRYRTEVNGDRAGQLRASKKMAEIIPTSVRFVNWIWHAFRSNYLDEVLEANTKISPDFSHLQYRIDLTATYHILGEHEKELEVARRGRRQYPNSRVILNCEVRALAAMGRTVEIDSLLSENRTMAGNHGNTLSIAAQILWTNSKKRDAVKLIERAVEWHSMRTGDEEKNLRRQYCTALYQSVVMVDRTTELQDDPEDPMRREIAGSQRNTRIEYMRETLNELCKEEPENLRNIGFKGIVAALFGDQGDALRVIQELEDLDIPYINRWDKVFQAYIMAILGHYEEATILFEDAFRNGANYFLGYHYQIELEGLREYPRFQDFLKPKK